MLSICMHVRSPVVDGRVNDVLLQTVPDFNEALLQLIDTVHTTFMCSLLHKTPDFRIHWIQVWAVWRPEIRTSVSCCISLMVSLARWHGACRYPFEGQPYPRDGFSTTVCCQLNVFNLYQQIHSTTSAHHTRSTNTDFVMKIASSCDIFKIFININKKCCLQWILFLFFLNRSLHDK